MDPDTGVFGREQKNSHLIRAIIEWPDGLDGPAAIYSQGETAEESAALVALLQRALARVDRE